MVLLLKALTMSPKKESPIDFEASQKNRKWEESLSNHELFKDQKHDQGKRKSIFDIELHLKTPLPSDKWQQYLTVQSGQIHLCNTRMNMKTQESKREWPLPEKTSLGQISLDLELNLTCESLKKKDESNYENFEKKRKINLVNELSISKSSKNDSNVLSTTPSNGDDDYKEMIATVCMKCHMLVMLCKSSPSCPNCKFMHPPQDQNTSKFLKGTRFSFLS
ncbi:unnamed protein product [Trifolium pratense]|uniref:Uncharacterized protein n=1 Tax=Trifolium pratense TaxID=57577 RepID=A0ACB0K8L1_TRIPR|nr:unnamed protein product [Trifolium pratense]